MKKKIIIIGVDSRIGNYLYHFLKKNFDVVGTSRRKKSNFYNLDLTWKLKKWPNLPNADVIICCAGMTDIQICEHKKKLSKKINVDGLEKIIKKYKNNFTQIIFFSSTSVFNGMKPFVREKNIRKPLNNYGRQKKVCEDLILKNNGVVIRCSKIVESAGELLIKWFKTAKRGKKINPYIEATSSLIKLKNVLDVVLFSINENKKNIFHLSGLNQITYEKIAKILLKKMNLSKKFIFPIRCPKKLRSNFGKYSTLQNSKKVKKITKIKKSEEILSEYIKKI